MNFTFIQGAHVAGTGTIHACSYVSPVTIGNLLIFSGTGYGTVPNVSNTVTDTRGNTWTQAIVGSVGSAQWASIWYCVNVGTGANIVTLGSAGSNQSFDVEEFSFTGSLSVATSSAAAMSAGSISFSGVGLAAGMLITNDVGGLVPVVGTGYTAGLDIANVGGQCQCSCFQYQNGVSGSANPTWTISGGGTAPFAVGIVFSTPAISPAHPAALLPAM